MMRLEIQLLGIFFCLFLFLILQFLYFQKKNQADLKKKLKKEWGKVSEKQYDTLSWERLTHYHQNHLAESYRIDSITWNDLDMDTIFCQMNHTHSSIGEEYLYYLLHTPAVEEKTLLERERLITFFSKQEKYRLDFELLATKIGDLKKESISDYLANKKTVPVLKQKNHIFSDLFLAGSLILLLFRPIVGIFALLAALTYSITFYYKEKAKAADYISCFKQIVRLLNALQELQKYHTPELKPYLDRMTSAQEKLKQLKRLSFFLPGSSISGSAFDVILDYICMLTHIDLILFNKMLKLLETHKTEIECCIEQFGFLESMISAASYRQALLHFCIPEFFTEENGKNSFCLELKEGYHPCIEKPVKNSIITEKSVLITGSNASGKSTFLKTVAIAALLAQTIHTVPASRYRAPFYQIYSSMAIRDNLSNQESYYMVEIKALKRILDAKKVHLPVLCFIDEVLRGTNTIERIAASTEILKSLASQQTLCFAATHDIELTQLLEEYENYYFNETIQNEDICFDYKLKKGISTSRNAIRLLKQLGYEEEIVNRALKRAEQFLKTGNWGRV